MAKYEIHAEDCPRLCKFWGTIAACEHARTGHACPPCSGSHMAAVDADNLEHLVNAAERHVCEIAGGCSLSFRLQPFRAGGNRIRPVEAPYGATDWKPGD